MQENKIIKNAIILCIITLTAVACLAFVNTLTKDPIKKNEETKRQKAYEKIFSDCTFETEELVKNDEGVTGACKVIDNSNKLIGYVYQVNGKGYGGNIQLVIGIALDGTCKGIEVIGHSETPGVGEKITKDDFKEKFIDIKSDNSFVASKQPTQDNDIEAISGATISSKAVVNALNKTIEYMNKNKEAQ